MIGKETRSLGVGIYFYSIRGVFSYGLWVLGEGAVLRNVGYGVEVPKVTWAGDGNCQIGTAESRFSAIAQYSGESSIPMARKPSCSAAMRVVPLPMNGSRTQSVGGRDESAEVAHEGEGLDGGVVVRAAFRSPSPSCPKFILTRTGLGSSVPDSLSGIPSHPISRSFLLAFAE